jgi:hypothetical protein
LSAGHPRKEALLAEPHVDEICSTIGNVARIAAVVELREAVAACAAAEHGPLELVLLDPHRKPVSARENLQNRRILEAFVQFRWHIDAIQRELAGGESNSASRREDVQELSRGSEG